MGIARGPNIIKDNLVFGYDTGYGVADNSTATRFYAGKNVDNEFYNSGANGNILDYSSGYGGIGTAQSGVLDASGTTENTVYRKTGKIRFGPTGGQDIGTLVNGNTYTFSIYLRHVTGQTQGGSMEFDIVDQSNGGTNFTGTLGSNMTYEWKRFSVTSTHTNSSNYHFIDIGVYQGTGVFEWCMPQIEQGTVMSPFTNTERSSTQSLIDLKRTSTIDMNTTSFDSLGQPDFDGSDDKGVITNFPHIWNGPVSVEAVAMWHDDTRSTILGNYNQGTGGHDINFEKLTGGALRFYWDRGSRDVTTTGNPRVTTNGSKYHHVVWVRDETNNSFRFYVDGVLVTTVSNAGSGITSTGSTFRFGADTRDGSTVHNGAIPIIKAYDIALSTGQVQQNFNAYKNRFNI